MTTPPPHEFVLDFNRLCDALRQADPDIIEITLFGSAAYAPDLAQDVDAIITTQHKKMRIFIGMPSKCAT